MKVIPFPKNKSEAEAGIMPESESLILPIAPRASTRIRFASSELRSSQVLIPENVQTLFKGLIARGKIPGEIIIEGPGDPLLTADKTFKILEKIDKYFRQIPLNLVTTGMGMESYAENLAGRGVQRVTMLMDTVSPDVAAKLYAWIRPGTKTIPLKRAIPMLLEEQEKAAAACLEQGIKITVRTTIYPGYNDNHAEKIAGKMVKLGADSMQLVPFAQHSEIDLPEADQALMKAVARLVSQHISNVSIVPETSGLQIGTGCPKCSCDDSYIGSTPLPLPTKERPNTAVTSSNGMDIDLHLGQAREALIYGPRGDGLTCLLERRQLPEPGGGEQRWQKLAEILKDCFALLTAGAGENPRKILGAKGITTLITEDDTEGTVDVLYGGGKKGKKKK